MTSFVRSLALLIGSLYLTLMVPLGLTLGSVRLMMTGTYLQVEYNKPDFPPDDYGFTIADRLHYAPVAVDYLVSGPDNALSVLTFADGRPVYNGRELQHMADVRRVTQGAFAGGMGIVVLGIGIGFLLAQSPAGRKALVFSLLRGAALTLVLIFGLALGVFVAWDTFFTQFHQLFFAEGTWQFAYTDSLIRLFPVRFWQDAALTIGGIASLGGLLILSICIIWLRRSIKSPAITVT